MKTSMFFDDFTKLEIRITKILKVEGVFEVDKLYQVAWWEGDYLWR